MTWQEVDDWTRLPGVHQDLPDPYLVWAHLTGWVDLRQPTPVGVDAVSLILELKPEASIKSFRAALKTFAPDDALVPAVYKQGRFLTAWMPLDRLAALVDPRYPTFSLIKRFDISVPVIPGRPPAPPLLGMRVRFNGKILMGVVDSGCPFAHHTMTRPAGKKLSTRIAAFWDMNSDARLEEEVLGAAVPALMGYGLQVLRGSGRGKGMDAWLDVFSQPTGLVDEAECYALANIDALRSQVSHGAHVLDVLAGSVPLRNRTYASHQNPTSIYTDPDSPPTWAAAQDAASTTDLVFAQLPRAALQDGTGGWLGSHVLDAASYLVSCAGAGTDHVVLNISYGCTVGPHDGSSILECALDAVARRKDARRRSPSVDVFIAAGNSFASGGHAVLTPRHFTDKLSSPIVWRVLPGAEAPAFVQLWFPPNSPGGEFTVEVAPPGAAAQALRVGESWVWPDRTDPSITAVFLSRCSRGSDSAMLLLAIAPTESADGSRTTAPHGDWHIRVRGSLRDKQEIHAYVARNDRDMDTALRGRTSRFVDEHEPLRYLAGCADDYGRLAKPIEDDPDREASMLSRRGTLNGIATGEITAAVAGYERRTGAHASYSSAGKSESPRGIGPESACATDESAALVGMRAAGNIGAATFRLVGTSTAAPQRARFRVNELAGASAPRRPPTPPHPDDPKQPEDLWGGSKYPVIQPR